MRDIEFKIAFAILYGIYSIIRMPHRIRYRKEVIKRTPHRLLEITFVGLFIVGITVLPLIWVFTDYFADFGMDIQLGFRYLGLAIALTSLSLFYWVHRYLNRNWSPSLEIREGHELVTSGPYKHVRHPMYTQIWLWTFAQVFIISNWVVGFGGIFTWAILYFLRVGREERMMLKEFGDTYSKYAHRTGRIFPRFFR